MSEKLKRARTKLVLSHPFFGCMLLSCRMIETNQVPTAATDGRDLYYNSAFIGKLKHEELMGLLAHEVMHKVFMHAFRRKSRNSKLWNIACDYAINLILSDENFILPEGGLLDEKYREMSADVIYNKILEEAMDNASGKRKQEGNGGDGDGEGQEAAIEIYLDSLDEVPDHLKEKAQQLTPAEQHELESDIKTQIAQAAQQAKQAGKLPGAISALVGELLKPKVDWKKALRDFIQQTAKTDYTFRRPNRRTLVHDLYLPSMTGDEMPNIVIAFDTSGSIYGAQKTTAVFVSEINSIIEDCCPAKVDVVYADSMVCHTQELDKHETLVPELEGGGGTAFSNTFKWIDNLDEKPAAILYFTDLYVSDFGQTDIPTLWCCYDNKEPGEVPFGTVVIIDED